MSVGGVIVYDVRKMAPGSKILLTFPIESMSKCKSGDKFVFQKEAIEILFSTNILSEQKELGVANIAGTCH